MMSSLRERSSPMKVTSRFDTNHDTELKIRYYQEFYVTTEDLECLPLLEPPPLMHLHDKNNPSKTI